MTSSPVLFPIEIYWPFYVAFTAMVVGILVLDLGLFHRNAHEVSIKESVIWSIVWFSLALVFGAFFYSYSLYQFSLDPRLTSFPGFDATEAARQSLLEYLTGFTIEKALAIDNIFVFVVVFSYFGIPAKYQHRVLFFGILGALVFRGLFVAAGAVLMQYKWVVILAGLFLIATGIKILFAPEKAPDPGKNPIIKLARRILPLTSELHGQRFWIKEKKKIVFTPLFLALLFIEFSDIIFAIDSVPAIFAVTDEPLIVFTSNIFAILGLRSLYFAISGVMDRFHYLKFGLGFILIFVGCKMTWLNEVYHGKFPISWSLGAIGAIIGISMVMSILAPPKTTN